MDEHAKLRSLQGIDKRLNDCLNLIWTDISKDLQVYNTPQARRLAIYLTLYKDIDSFYNSESLLIAGITIQKVRNEIIEYHHKNIINENSYRITAKVNLF